MKKIICFAFALLMIVSAVGCSSSDRNVIDMTNYDERLTYLELTKMVEDPKEYDGKKVMLRGMYMVVDNQITGEKINACVVNDETACCSTYIEFELAEGVKMPEMNSKITISGEFEATKQISSYVGKLSNVTFLDQE